MIEAMACGTPVIAFNRGSVPEVVDDGLTGFIVEDETGAIGAVDRLGHLSREKIRAQFEQRFTARRMAQDYLAVYRGSSTAWRRICGWSRTTRRPCRSSARARGRRRERGCRRERLPLRSPQRLGGAAIAALARRGFPASAARPPPTRRPRSRPSQRRPRGCRNGRSHSRRAWRSATRQSRSRCRRSPARD